MTDDRNQLLDALIAEHRRQAEFDPAVAALAINSVLVERPAAENAELLAIAISRLTVGMIRMSKALKALISAVRRPGRVSAMHRAYRTKTRRRNRRTGHGTR